MEIVGRVSSADGSRSVATVLILIQKGFVDNLFAEMRVVVRAQGK